VKDIKKFNGMRITDKQVIIICIIYQFRGLHFGQLMPELAQRMQRDNAISFKKNSYKDLQQLEEMRLIIRDPIKLERTVDFITLTESGLECASEILNIPYGYVSASDGWGSDWGDFPFDLYKPPKVGSTMIHHHLMLTDVLLTFQAQQRADPDLKLDFRDNRYNSKEYESGGQIHRFRPDADFVILNGKRFLVECDRGTEYGEKLREKFRTYNGYLMYLQSIGEPLPVGVLFVMNKESANGMARRWSLVALAFMAEMSEWNTRFNLIGVSVSEIKSAVLKESKRDSQYSEFFQKASLLRSDIISFGILKEGDDLQWSSPTFSIVKKESENKMFVFERIEPYETIGISRIYAWLLWYREAKKKYTDIGKAMYPTPVLWRQDGGSFPLHFKGFDIEKELESLFKNCIWIRTDRQFEWHQ
jgi:DNA-binding MarR family transcriptional regulator